MRRQTRHHSRHQTARLVITLVATLVMALGIAGEAVIWGGWGGTGIDLLGGIAVSPAARARAASLAHTLAHAMAHALPPRTPTPSPSPAPSPSPSPSPDPTPSPPPEPQLNGYVTRVFTDAMGATMTYYLHVPSGYDPTRRYPLVLLLHGGDESAAAGDTPQQNATVLLSDPYVRVWTGASVQTRWPSVIVVPQLVAPDRWVNVPADRGSYALAPQPSASLRLAMEIVGAVEGRYAVDPRRIYLTGLSMGGYGAWEAAERWPSYFAAVVPLAGAGDPLRALDLVHMPIWAFHGADDTLVPVSGSRDMIQAIRDAGGSPCYTEFAGASHDIWIRVYGDDTLIAWLFAQGTPAATAPAARRCSA